MVPVAEHGASTSTTSRLAAASGADRRSAATTRHDTGPQPFERHGLAARRGACVVDLGPRRQARVAANEGVGGVLHHESPLSEPRQMHGKRQTGSVVAVRDPQPGVVRGIFYTETGLAERPNEHLLRPPGRLYGEGRPGVVPGYEARRLGRPERASPPGDEPSRVRPLTRFPCPVSRFPYQTSERLVHVAGRVLADRLAREIHAGGHRGVGRHARLGTQLVCAEPEDVVEAGVRPRQLELPVECRLAAEHPGGELVGESPIPLVERSEMPVACRREGCAGSDRVEDLQRRAPGGGGVPNPASPRAARTARRPPSSACDRRDRRPVPLPPPGASPAPLRRDRAPRRGRCSSGCRPRPAPL